MINYARVSGSCQCFCALLNSAIATANKSSRPVVNSEHTTATANQDDTSSSCMLYIYICIYKTRSAHLKTGGAPQHTTLAIAKPASVCAVEALCSCVKQPEGHPSSAFKKPMCIYRLVLLSCLLLLLCYAPVCVSNVLVVLFPLLPSPSFSKLTPLYYSTVTATAAKHVTAANCAAAACVY